MPTRTFTDRQGDRWSVWKTVPEDARGCLPSFAHGWLTFEREGGAERRRLVPIPEEWEAAPDERLLLWCLVAEPARIMSRVTPAGGTAAVADDEASEARARP